MDSRVDASFKMLVGNFLFVIAGAADGWRWRMDGGVGDEWRWLQKFVAATAAAGTAAVADGVVGDVWRNMCGGSDDGWRQRGLAPPQGF